MRACAAAAVLVTAVASWLYAGAALSPIGRVVDAARQVRDSRDLTRRVPRLVATFNDMLAELEQASPRWTVPTSRCAASSPTAATNCGRR